MPREFDSADDVRNAPLPGVQLSRYGVTFCRTHSEVPKIHQHGVGGRDRVPVPPARENPLAGHEVAAG